MTLKCENLEFYDAVVSLIGLLFIKNTVELIYAWKSIGYRDDNWWLSLVHLVGLSWCSWCISVCPLGFHDG